LEISEIEPTAVVVEPMLALPLLPMPPVTSPVTASVMAILLPSAFLNCRSPPAAVPVTVMLASASARLTAVSPVSAASSAAAVTPPPAAVPACCTAMVTPPTDSV
jgi:hypothetical protein